jgi:hypothetical protein
MRDTRIRIYETPQYTIRIRPCHSPDYSHCVEITYRDKVQEVWYAENRRIAGRGIRKLLAWARVTA